LPVLWSIGSWKVWQQLIKKGTMIAPGPGAAYASSGTHPSYKRHHMAHGGLRRAR
jgi:hypothetical protein